MTTIRQIQEGVAAYYGLERVDFLRGSQCRRIARPRQVSMFLSRKLTNSSLPLIGKCHGYRHHATVIHGIRRIEELRLIHPELNHAIETAGRLCSMSYLEWVEQREAIKSLANGLRGLPVGSYSGLRRERVNYDETASPHSSVVSQFEIRPPLTHIDGARRGTVSCRNDQSRPHKMATWPPSRDRNGAPAFHRTPRQRARI